MSGIDKSATIPVHEMPPEQLADGCRNQRGDSRHEPFCFELFKRAIAKQCQRSWSAIYRQYDRMVHKWVLDAIQKAISAGKIVDDIAPEELVSVSFTKFWRFYQPEQLNQAQGLSSILSYLKTCTMSTVQDQNRRVRIHTQQAEWEEELTNLKSQSNMVSSDVAAEIIDALEADALWQVIGRYCHDDKERVIAKLSFVSDLTPKRIMNLHPELFESQKEIYSLRKNLRNRLRRSEELQEYLKS